jgi:ankyrin repeat protein
MSKLRNVGYKRSETGAMSEYHEKLWDNAYRINLERITDRKAGRDDAVLAEKVFSVLSVAIRLLTVAELQHAICTIQNIDQPPDFQQLHSWEALQASCRGLIQQDQAGFVTFTHSNLQVFLTHHFEYFEKRENWMAQSCFRYLDAECLSGGICRTTEALRNRIRDWPFAMYAAHYWQEHLIHDPMGLTSKSCDERCEYAVIFLRDSKKVEAAVQISCTPDDLKRRILSQLLNQTDGHKYAQVLKLSRVLVLQAGDFPLNFKNLEPNNTVGLHWACRLGCRSLFNRLRYGDPDLQRKDWLLNTPLHYAASFGHADLVQDLLDAQAKPDARNISGSTPLTLAAREGRLAVVEILLKLKNTVDINNVDRYYDTDWSELHIPLDDDSFTLDAIKGAIAVGGRTPLHHAARNDRVDVVRLLLEDARIKVDHRDEYGLTALHRAAKKGNLRTVIQLLSHEMVDLKARIQKTKRGPVEYHGDTFLHQASRYPRKGNATVVEFVGHLYPELVNAQNAIGDTPLHCAVERSAWDSVRFLLNSSTVDPNIQNYESRSCKQWSGKLTPLHLAVEFESPWRLILLLMCSSTASLNPDIEDQHGRTPLQTAIDLKRKAHFALLYYHWGANHWALQLWHRALESGGHFRRDPGSIPTVALADLQTNKLDPGSISTIALTMTKLAKICFLIWLISGAWLLVLGVFCFLIMMVILNMLAVATFFACLHALAIVRRLWHYERC